MFFAVKFFLCKKYIGPTADPDLITLDWVKMVTHYMFRLTPSSISDKL